MFYAVEYTGKRRAGKNLVKKVPFRTQALRNAWVESGVDGSRLPRFEVRKGMRQAVTLEALSWMEVEVRS